MLLYHWIIIAQSDLCSVTKPSSIYLLFFSPSLTDEQYHQGINTLTPLPNLRQLDDNLSLLCGGRQEAVKLRLNS